MAHEQNLVRLPFEAGADLSGKQYYAVKLNSSGKLVLAGAGEAALGVLQNAGAAGRMLTVAVGGVTKFKCGGTIAAGGHVASDANGKAKAAVAANTKTDDAGAAADALLGSYVLGIHVGSGAAADGDIIPVFLTHAGSVPTTAS